MKMRPTSQPNSAGGVPLIVPHVSNKGVVPDDLRTQFALIESVSCTKSPVSLRKENSKSNTALKGVSSVFGRKRTLAAPHN